MAQCWLHALKKAWHMRISKRSVEFPGEHDRKCWTATPGHRSCCKYTGLLLNKHHEVQLGDKSPQAEKDILLLNKKSPPAPTKSFSSVISCWIKETELRRRWHLYIRNTLPFSKLRKLFPRWDGRGKTSTTLTKRAIKLCNTLAHLPSAS